MALVGAFSSLAIGSASSTRLRIRCSSVQPIAAGFKQEATAVSSGGKFQRRWKKKPDTDDGLSRVVAELRGILESKSPKEEKMQALAALIQSSQLINMDATVSRVLQRLKDPDAAVMFFGWAMTVPGYIPNTVAYNCLLNTLAKAGKIQQVRKIVEGGNFEPNQYTFGILVQAHCNVGEFTEVYKMIESAKNSNIDIGSMQVLHNTLLKGFCEAGLVSEAKKHFEEMDVRPNKIGYNTLLEGLCKAERIDEAAEKLEQMKQDNFPPEYRVLVSHMCERGQEEAAMKLLMALKSPVSANVYSPIVRSFCKAGMPEKARKVVEEMLVRSVKPDYQMLSRIVQAFCDTGKVNEALEMLEMVLKMGFFPTTATCNVLVKLLCERNKLDHAEKLIGIMQNSMRGKCNPDGETLSMIGQKFVEVGRIDDAEKFMEQILASGFKPSESFCSSYICNSRNPDSASKLLQLMDGSKDVGTFNSVMEGCFRSGRIDEAVEAFAGMLSVECIPDSSTYSILIRGLCDAKQFEQAVAVLEQITEPACDPDSAALARLIEALCRSGEADKAKSVLQRMPHQAAEFSPCRDLVLHEVNRRR